MIIFCGVLKHKIFATCPHTTAKLINNIRTAVRNIPVKKLEHAADEYARGNVDMTTTCTTFIININVTVYVLQMVIYKLSLIHI